MKIVIDIPEEIYDTIQSDEMISREQLAVLQMHILNGTSLPKGHGRLIDIGTIDKDRIDHDNPVIYLTVNGEYIEAVSIDYLERLPTIVGADKESEDKAGDEE